MPDSATPTAVHLRRAAIVYVRQSSPSQLERNTESTQRQYALVTRAVELGFAREAVVVIDEDLGVSGSGVAERSGFARLTAEVALRHVGLVLGLEVSRLARIIPVRGVQAAQQPRKDRAGLQQVGHRAERLGPVRLTLGSGLKISPGSGDQRLAAIRQHQRQFQDSPPPLPAQHL